MSDGYVYILSNSHLTVLYTGCTNDLKKRIYFRHQRRLVPGFTRKYNVHRLVYYEKCPGMEGARVRERQIKGLTRAKKEALVVSMNDSWRDLYPEIT